MELKAFFEKVEAHPQLTGLGVDTQDIHHCVIVRYEPSQLITRIPVAAIPDFEWGLLEDVLTGLREPQVLQHMTRVVGYFSRVENWNRSKVGELKDRHKGNYAIAG